MKTDPTVDVLYRKLSGLSFDRDVYAPDGTILGHRIRKRNLATFISRGGLPALLELLLVDPSKIQGYGTQRIRKQLDQLALTRQTSGHHLAAELSRVLNRASV